MSEAVSAALEVLNWSAMLCAAPSPVMTQFNAKESAAPMAAPRIGAVSTKTPALAVEQAALSVRAACATTAAVAVESPPLAEMPSFQPVGIVTV